MSWPDYRWYVLGARGLVALVLGNIGFWQLWREHPKPSDVVFWSFKLFLAMTPVNDHLPVTLDIARFLGPIVASFAGLSGLASLFRDRVQQMRVPLMRGHVVVCGVSGSVRLIRACHDCAVPVGGVGDIAIGRTFWQLEAFSAHSCYLISA